MVNYIKTQRLSWYGHVKRITNDTTVKKLYECKLISIGLAGRPNSRQENDTQEDLGIMRINSQTKFIQDWLKWKKVVEKAKTFKQ